MHIVRRGIHRPKPENARVTRSTCSTEVEHQNRPKMPESGSKTHVAPLAPLRYALYMFLAPRAAEPKKAEAIAQMYVD
jgi:hypothetical protein